MVRKITVGALAALSLAACAADVDDDPGLSQTEQASYGTVDGQCVARCTKFTDANGRDDVSCVPDPCWQNGECELDSCDEVALYAANHNTTFSTYRCQLGSVLYDGGFGSGMVANCDPDGDGKINQDKFGLCCTKVEFRPEIFGIGKAFDVNYQTGPESFMVPDSLPPNASYTLNDFCPRTDITQTETTPIHGDATRTTNGCPGKPTIQWMRTEVNWPVEPEYGGLWKDAMKCGSDVLSLAVAVFELYVRKDGVELFPKIAGVITGGTGAVGSCVEMFSGIPSGETSKRYVTWEAVGSNGQRGQFNDPMFYTMPTYEHYDTNVTSWSTQGTRSQTMKACRRHIQGRFVASRRARQWSFWEGEWQPSDSQYRVGFKYFDIPGATFEIEASEPCTCRANADAFGIDCTGKKTAYAGGGSYLITSDSDNRNCVKHCFRTDNCFAYDCDQQPPPACPIDDYFPGGGSGSAYPGFP